MAFDFKKEEDVKDYLKNLEIQYKFGCHSEKNPEACHLLGDFQEAVKRDFPVAGKIYKTNCDENNFARSCHIWGSYLVLGKGIEKENPLEAYRYFSKGCEMEHGDSCCNAGVILTSGGEKYDFLKNMNRGVEMLKRGCNFGSDKACLFISGLYISGSSDQTVTKNMDLAAEYAKKGCDLNNAFACSNLSIMYKRGDGVEKNLDLAEQFKKKALELQKQYNDDLLVNFQRGAT